MFLYLSYACYHVCVPCCLCGHLHVDRCVIRTSKCLCCFVCLHVCTKIISYNSFDFVLLLIHTPSISFHKLQFVNAVEYLQMNNKRVLNTIHVS